MTIAIAVLTAAVLCWLHSRAMNSQRQTLEDRLDHQAQRHAMDLRKLIEASERERLSWHHTLTAELTAAQGQLTALLKAQETERDRWLEERTLLLNRIKPETAQPVMHTGEFFAPPAVEPDDDQAYWESKEAMADRLAQTERELQRMSA
jgi:hypothetical protein